MGISRDSRHKRRNTGGKRKIHQKKRKFELGRPAANTKLGARRIHHVRTRGGNTKFRAIRLDTGNFSWSSEAVARKSRILTVVYNASNNELVRTQTLVKGAIIQIDATPFRSFYEQKYGITLGKKKGKDEEKQASKQDEKAPSDRRVRRLQQNKKQMYIDPAVEEQFNAGRLLACLASRPGQVGRADGYILEGKELEFYQKKLQKKKNK